MSGRDERRRPFFRPPSLTSVLNGRFAPRSPAIRDLSVDSNDLYSRAHSLLRLERLKMQNACRHSVLPNGLRSRAPPRRRLPEIRSLIILSLIPRPIDKREEPKRDEGPMRFSQWRQARPFLPSQHAHNLVGRTGIRPKEPDFGSGVQTMERRDPVSRRKCI